MKFLTHLVPLMVALAGYTSAFAQATFNVTVKHQNKKLEVNFSTKAEMSSMCGLSLSRLTLEKPLIKSSAPNGLVSFDAAVEPNTMCLMAFGPHRGSVVLDLGYDLPALTTGYYDLVINGILQGSLIVDGAKSRFEEFVPDPEILFDGRILSSSVALVKKPDGSKVAQLTLKLSYTGGCEKHVFELSYGACLESYPAQCSATLIHKEGSDDRCKSIVTEDVTFDLPSHGGDRYFLTITGASDTISTSVYVDMNPLPLKLPPVNVNPILLEN